MNDKSKKTHIKVTCINKNRGYDSILYLPKACIGIEETSGSGCHIFSLCDDSGWNVRESIEYFEKKLFGES